MEYVNIPGIDVPASRIGLGTWAIGGWMWDGTDEDLSIRTIVAALERGVTLIDTAPAYGQGRVGGNRRQSARALRPARSGDRGHEGGARVGEERRGDSQFEAASGS